MTFSEKIKELRLRRGMTFQQVADIVGVGKSTVRKWETGDIEDMGRSKIARIADALGVHPAYLMGWSENESGNDMLTDNERRLIAAYRRAVPVIRDAAMQMLESNPAKEKEHLA